MTKKNYIALLIIIGFFLIPSFTYACNKEMGTDLKQCCQKSHLMTDTTSHTNDLNHCSGKHTSASCHCSTASICCALPLIALFINNTLPDFLEIKTKFGYKNPYYTSVFKSLWLPPKIA